MIHSTGPDLGQSCATKERRPWSVMSFSPASSLSSTGNKAPQTMRWFASITRSSEVVFPPARLRQALRPRGRCNTNIVLDDATRTNAIADMSWPGHQSAETCGARKSCRRCHRRSDGERANEFRQTVPVRTQEGHCIGLGQNAGVGLAREPNFWQNVQRKKSSHK